jgi:uroporphyrinogen-III decarboxylase
MKDAQWQQLLEVIQGREVRPLPVGFIIDSPWLPGWCGMTLMDYFSSDDLWLEANLRALQEFPEVCFLPGFWSEYGMCTEPSAFGARCRFPENEFPFAEKVIASMEQAGELPKPDPRTDGLLPFVLKRLQHSLPAIQKAGHQVRFAVARGPMNIASFLSGTTEFMIAIKCNPEEVHALLETITSFLMDWLEVQVKAFPTIQGIFLLDDVVGFLRESDFQAFALPYLRRIYQAFPFPVKFFHNDAKGATTAKYLNEIGINLFNFSFQHSLAEMKAWAGNSVTLLGNIPPRDVLAQGSPDEVFKTTRESLASIQDHNQLILSCGGGMPPEAPTENIRALLRAAGR